MLSRVAENLYWIGRYVERAENVCRIVEVNGYLLLDLPRGIAPGWQPLVAIIGGSKQFESSYDEYSERNVVRFLLTDANNPGSMISSLELARENARTVRDYLPREAWQLINETYLYAKESANSGLAKRTRADYLQRISRDAQALYGMILGSMNQDAGRHFMLLGQSIERADMTTRIIDVRSATLLTQGATDLLPFENIQWIGVLKSLTAYQMYRRKMQVRVRRADALRFLLMDDEFPRSVYYCVDCAASELAELPDSAPARRRLSKLKRTLRAAPVVALVEDQGALNEFLDALQLALGEVDALVRRTYFLLLAPPKGAEEVLPASS